MKQTILRIMTSSGHETAEAVIDRIGTTSVMTSIGIQIADETGAIELSSSLGGMWGAVDWLAALAAMGTITFIVKNITSARKTYLEIQLLKIQNKEKE